MKDGRCLLLDKFLKLIFFLLVMQQNALAQAKVEVISPGDSERLFARIPSVDPMDLDAYRVNQSQKAQKIKELCDKLQGKYGEYRWKDNACGDVRWQAEYHSPDGYPLLYKVFGEGSNTTLILSGVHPDERTPIHLAFKFANYLKKNPQLYTNNNVKVIVAPLVNPDGFVIEWPTRTNSHGVDVNRNFYTLDWYDSAIKSWRRRRGARPRYFPGYFPNTEIETIFQTELLSRFNPEKIISIHAPLGFLDYDGPAEKAGVRGVKKASKLVQAIAEKSKNYRVVNYSSYPGSLGNYAGNEREIATVTLELETANPRLVDVYWKKFLPGMISSTQYSMVFGKRKDGPVLKRKL